MQLPTVEEIEALLADRKQTAIVFFLDETFEELEYDATTTVLEAVDFLAGVIKLQNYHTFTLYECRKVMLTLLACILLNTNVCGIVQVLAGTVATKSTCMPIPHHCCLTGEVSCRL